MTQPYVSDDTPVQLAEELERMADTVEEFEPLDAAKLRVAALILRSKTQQYMVWSLEDLGDDIGISLKTSDEPFEGQADR